MYMRIHFKNKNPCDFLTAWYFFRLNSSYGAGFRVKRVFFDNQLEFRLLSVPGQYPRQRDAPAREMPLPERGEYTSGIPLIYLCHIS